MKNILALMALIFIMLGLNSCPEENAVVPSKNELLIEKSVLKSDFEQIIESGDNIRIVFPGGSLKSDLELKVVKVANPPKLERFDLELGKNIFQVTLNGEFNSDAVIFVKIKYDKSKIISENDAENIVKGLFYYKSWQIADYSIDTDSEEIVIESKPDLGVKSYKDSPELQSEDEIIFGDSYTVTDTGDSDELLSILKYIQGSIQIYRNDGKDYNFNFGNYISKTPQISWNKNRFTITAPYIPNESMTGVDNKVVCIISGEFVPNKVDAWDWKLKNFAVDIDGSFKSDNWETFIQYTIRFNDLNDGWYRKAGSNSILGYSYQWSTFTSSLIKTFDYHRVHHDWTDAQNEKWTEDKYYKSDIDFNSNYNFFTLNFTKE